MNITNREIVGAYVPPFSYTAIAHTFRNSPFNEYPYAMARLRWFSSSFDPTFEPEEIDLHFDAETDYLGLVRSVEEQFPEHQRLIVLRSVLLHNARMNGNFTYLHVSDAGLVDAILDIVFRHITGGIERDTKDLGPHEQGIGKWINEDDFNERHWLYLPAGVDRQEIFEYVNDRLRSEQPEDATFDELYLYPPNYGDGPDEPVKHTFRVFGRTRSDHPPSDEPRKRLGVAVEEVLDEIVYSSN